MDGTVVILIVVPIILLIIVINTLREQQKLLLSLHNKVNRLKDELSALSKDSKESSPVTSTISEVKPFIPPAKIPQPEMLPETGPSTGSTVREFPASRKTTAVKNKEADLEKFIGENLANKIGIAVLVLGISFFVKYAIDKDWIGEVGRVLIGLLSGAILIGLAHRFRNTYRSFSSVLVGGGLTVFYFTIAYAFHQYHLLSQSAAFIIMVIIAGFGVALSLYYDRKELAILATIGGFITPFLVTTGQENYIALFTYLAILCSALIVLAWYKRWSVINSVALFFTTIIYSGWLVKHLFFDRTLFPANDAFFFASLFYLLFFAMHTVNTLRLRKTFTAFDFCMVLGTNILYYAAGIAIWRYIDAEYGEGIFTLLVGLFNLALAGVFAKTRRVDGNFVRLLIATGIGFISLFIPIQFNGNVVVLCWAVELLILFNLYRRTKFTLLLRASQIMSVWLAISAILNWFVFYFFQKSGLPIIINKGFISTVVAGIALLIYHHQLRKETTTSDSSKTGYLVTGIFLLFIAGAGEINYQVQSFFSITGLSFSWIQSYSFVFILVLLKAYPERNTLPIRKITLLAAAVAFYIIGINDNIETALLLRQGNHSSLFGVHWVGVMVLGWMLVDFLRTLVRSEDNQWQEYRYPFTWLACFSMVLLLSSELYQVIFWTQYTDPRDWEWWQNLYSKACLSICWSICSFLMMWIGMKRNFKTLRVISLTLFSITIGKLFIYDIRNMPAGGKIAAFILLGVLLLAVSFMYQRLKKLLLDKD